MMFLVHLDDSPTARALRTLELVQTTPGITADRLSSELGVSERAARRYIGILREAGIRVDSTRGKYGGYTVSRGLRVPPLVFTATEALALVMAVLDGHHDAADPTNPVGGALAKIVRALPEPIAARAESVRRMTSAAPDRGAARPDAGTTATLVQACADGRVIRVAYQSESGNEWTAEVEPWSVVVRHGRWYLLCHSRAAGAARTYRIDRVATVEVLDETCEPPADLDPVESLEEHLGSGWEFTTEVVIDAPLELVARCLPRTLGQLTTIDERSTRLVGSTSNPTWYAEQLATSPAPFRVVGGEELRTAVAEIAARMAAAIS